MSLNYRPSRNGIVIKVETKSESGIILSEEAQQSVGANKYQIVAVGSKCEEAKVGDWVDFIMHCAPTAIIVDGEKYMVLKEHEILGYYETSKLVA